MEETPPAPPSTGMGSSARGCGRPRLPSSGDRAVDLTVRAADPGAMHAVSITFCGRGGRRGNPTPGRRHMSSSSLLTAGPFLALARSRCRSAAWALSLARLLLGTRGQLWAQPLWLLDYEKLRSGGRSESAPDDRAMIPRCRAHRTPPLASAGWRGWDRSSNRS
jgi:hypothetical protein